jgi:uncharacterized protein
MITKMHKIIVALSLFLVGAGCNPGSIFDKNIGLFQEVENLKTITVGKEQLRVEVANNDDERARGLSGLDSLPQTQGMLFDFTNSPERKPDFWMKGMKFNIDIVWIKDNQVIEITKNVPAPVNTDYYPIYAAPREIDYVLEVNAGWKDLSGVGNGTLVQL